MFNHNNRPSISVSIGALAQTETLPLLIADKKMKILSAKFVQEGAISASGVNYLAMQLKKNNVAVGAAVNTQAGLAARTAKALDVTGLTLESGDYLSLGITETGVFAEGTPAILVLDVEVIGN